MSAIRRSASSVPRMSGCHSLALARYARATSSGEEPGATPRTAYGSTVKGYEAVMPRLKAVPWMIALDAALVLRDLWGKLEPRERRRLGELVRRGRSMNDREKAELKRLVS